MAKINGYPKLSAEEAAAQIPHGATVAFSGFSAAGAAKAVPRAIAKRARSLGATEGEIAETVGMAFIMGGLPGLVTGANAFRE